MFWLRLELLAQLLLDGAAFFTETGELTTPLAASAPDNGGESMEEGVRSEMESERNEAVLGC